MKILPCIKTLVNELSICSNSSLTAVRRHCTDWYEIWALTDHEIYYIKIELDLRKFSNGPFSETEKAFWVNPTPGGSQCTGLSPTLSWKWPRATLSPSFGPFFERNHSFGVKMVSGNVWKTFKSCPWSWYPARAKQIYTSGKRSYTSGGPALWIAFDLLPREVASFPLSGHWVRGEAVLITSWAEQVASLSSFVHSTW